jgi:putative transposase
VNTYQFIAAQAAQHAVRLLCRVLGVSRSGFFAWRSRLPAARARADEALTEQIRQIHAHSRQTYGSIRVRATLRERGEMVGRRRVARLMRGAGLRGVHGQRRRVRTTVADPHIAPAPDRVERAFAPAAIGGPDRLWLADISYIPTREGWLYLAIILDGFSRRVVGWAMADHLQTDLVLAALRLALQRRRPAAGLIHHSDRGASTHLWRSASTSARPAWSRPPARSGTATTMRSPNRSSPRSKWSWSIATTGRRAPRPGWPSSNISRSGTIVSACIPHSAT